MFIAYQTGQKVSGHAVEKSVQQTATGLIAVFLLRNQRGIDKDFSAAGALDGIFTEQTQKQRFDGGFAPAGALKQMIRQLP